MHLFEAVFISDLHLHPDNPVITARFDQFINWAAKSTKTLYILGDFFHVWPGDDGLTAWSEAIANKLNGLAQQGIKIYFMHGNRDFLLGTKFAALAGMDLLVEPAVINYDQKSVLLVHGDRYCSKDRSHQRFRCLTRNNLFIRLFLKLPLRWRQKMVNSVRKMSQAQTYNPDAMQVIPESMIAHMKHYKVDTVIHGHTHKPGLVEHCREAAIYKQYVLSDWDDSPDLLCYHNTIGFYFVQFKC